MPGPPELIAGSGRIVHASLPIRIKKVGEAERRRQCEAVLGGVSLRALPCSEAFAVDRRNPLKALSQRIDALEAKIDMLVGLALRREHEKARQISAPLELSADRVSFRTCECFDVGQALELRVSLSLYPPVEISCIAEVSQTKLQTWDEDEVPMYRVDAIYSAISEADIDEIHRFILTTERERRRAKPSNKD